MEFSHEELCDVIDRLVAGLLERAGVDEAPVNALAVAEDHLGIPVEVVEPAEEDERGRRRPAARPASFSIVLSPDMTEGTAKGGCGWNRALLPDILRKLDVSRGPRISSSRRHVRGLVVGRVLVPTKDCGSLPRVQYDRRR